MRRTSILWALLVACSPPREAPTTAPTKAAAAAPSPPAATSLRDVVRRDTTLFSLHRPPAALVDAMAEHRVVILGELHLLVEHHDFVATTLEALHQRGTRLLLLESFQAHSERANRFVLGETDVLPPATEKFFGYLLRRVRAFNEGLEATDRVHVAFVDINHAASALPGAIALDQAERPQPGPQRDFLAQIGWDPAKPHDAQQEALAAAWRSNRQPLDDALVALRRKLDPSRDTQLIEAIDVAIRSIEIKTIWDEQGENAAHPLREEVINRLVDAQLADARGPVLINIGGYHAQRKHLMGTPKQWLAERLAAPEGAARGSVYSIYVNAAAAEQLAGTEVRDLSIKEDPAELMWQIADLAKDQAAYLPLTDPLFARESIRVHYLYSVLEHRPAEQFDAYILLPRGTLLPPFVGG